MKQVGSDREWLLSNGNHLHGIRSIHHAGIPGTPWSIDSASALDIDRAPCIAANYVLTTLARLCDNSA